MEYESSAVVSSEKIVSNWNVGLEYTVGAFLTQSQIQKEAAAIRDAFEELISSRRLTLRSSAKQWRFFRHCFNVLMGEARGEFLCSGRSAAQYKLEVSNRLRQYYRLPGDPLRFIFTLAHRSDRQRVPDDDYPNSHGYCLLVTRNVADLVDTTETEILLERVIADAVDAEWAAYLKLPQINLDLLEDRFDPNGSAYKRIRMLVDSHHRKHWTISNTGNPSTRRLLKTKVMELSGDSAQVRTQEYWYLRWWSLETRKYVHVYNELNYQVYFLAKQGDRWLVSDNFYPKTKTSTPLRWRDKSEAL